MRTKLKVEDKPTQRRVVLITEPADAPKEESVVEDEVTEWFSDSVEPPCSGEWEVREKKSGAKVLRRYYSRQHGWLLPPRLESFNWRGLKKRPVTPRTELKK